MTGFIATLSQSKEFAFVVFAGCAVFTVVGLEVFRTWYARTGRTDKRPRAIAAIVAIVFMLMLALGFGDLFWEGKKFLNLSLALFGVAGLAILAQLTRGGDTDDELRKIDAHDL